MKSFEEIKSTRNITIKGEAPGVGLGGTYYDSISGKSFNFIFSKQFGWEHLSVSTPSKTPTWEQMCKMKDLFWNEDEVCVQYHPAKEDYVNNHPHCLHIWRPVASKDFINSPTSKEDLLPVPPSILVGYRNEEEKKAVLAFCELAGIKINDFR